jgi:predicted 3-demethylubiquinone-9 3-methyltransferase (glyoxalase superfamily)
MTEPTDKVHWAEGRLTLSLWFDDGAEQAWELYSSLFSDAELRYVSRHGADGMGPEGQVHTMGWKLNGLDIMVINGGPMYSFTPAASLVAPCDTQEEIDRLWDALTADGGKPVQCGWLEDRFGLSWQIVPSRLGDWIGHPDPEAAARATQAMLSMEKLDIAALEAAAEGR